MKSLGKRLTMAVAATLLGIAVNIPSLSAAAGATHPTDLSSPPHKIVNVAHRGASGYAPEHTIPA